MISQDTYYMAFDFTLTSDHVNKLTLVNSSYTAATVYDLNNFH